MIPAEPRPRPYQNWQQRLAQWDLWSAWPEAPDLRYNTVADSEMANSSQSPSRMSLVEVLRQTIVVVSEPRAASERDSCQSVQIV